jgi:putative transposase
MQHESQRKLLRYAVVESFFHSLKVEWIYDNLYQTRDEARLDVIKYIEMFYNSQRLHSFLDYKSPNNFESGIPLANAA